MEELNALFPPVPYIQLMIAERTVEAEEVAEVSS